MNDSIADDILRNGYERWLRLEEEKAAIGDDLKELMAEMKGHGFTPKAVRESFRRVRSADSADQQEHDAIVDLYVASLTRARPTHAREGQSYAGAKGREPATRSASVSKASSEEPAETPAASFNPETGEITDTQEQPQVEAHDAEVINVDSAVATHEPASVERDQANAGGGDVDRSALRASSAVEVGATNSPDGQTSFSSLNSFSGIGSARETSAMLHPGVVDGPTASLAGRDSGDSAERRAPHSEHHGCNGPVMPVDTATDKQAACTDRPDSLNSQASSVPADTAGEARPSSHGTSPATLSDDDVPTFLKADHPSQLPNPKCRKPGECKWDHGVVSCWRCNSAPARESVEA